MRSSISSSDPPDRFALNATTTPRTRFATFAVIGLVVAVFLGAEILCRYAFPRISQIEGRIRNDEYQAMSIRSPVPGSTPTVLLVGNSLLLRGLDYPRIRTEMAPDARVVRFVIENTEYLDWYYGLHHMFATGVHPSMVVLCLNLGQTVSSRTLGDYSARHLFGPSELLPVAHEAGMNATRTSGLILAHWSAFYASRATVRNFILNITDPPYARAMHTLADSTANPLPPDDEMVNAAGKRLQSIQQLCNQNGIDLVVLIPPSLARYNDLLASAAGLQHVKFDYPLPLGALSKDYFLSDGVHLNQNGAAVFTSAIARCLRARLANGNEVDRLQLR
jgi:hypothetical protein